MTRDIIIGVIAAIVGGLVTIMVTFLNNRARRLELEYSYRAKLQETYLSNARHHLHDVYIPMFKIIAALQDAWEESKSQNPRNFQNCQTNIDEWKALRTHLIEQGLAAFLTPDVEHALNNLLGFWNRSQNVRKATYALDNRIFVLGQDYSSYEVMNQWVGYYLALTIVVFAYILSSTLYSQAA